MLGAGLSAVCGMHCVRGSETQPIADERDEMNPSDIREAHWPCPTQKESRMRIPRMLLSVVLPVLSIVAIASGNSPFAGTWKFNPAKSKMGASDTTSSDVMRIKSDGKTISLMDEEVD